MKCTFYRPENVNTDEFENIIEKMHYDLISLNRETADAYRIAHYVYRLLQEAKPLEKNPEMYFWGMCDPRSMPSDVRVEYFYKPTYIATAFLMKAVLLFPEIDNKEGFEWDYSSESKVLFGKIMPGALLGCTGRGFAGSGYDDVKGIFDAMEILTEGCVQEFLEKYPDMCSEFTELYRNTEQMIEENVASGEWRNGWGEDYLPRAKKVLAKIKNSEA